MFQYLAATILGIVEGFTEFLPISSTGHLILVNQWISFSKDFTLLFDIVIQLGAILAVVVFFWKKLWPFYKDATKNKETWNIWFKTIIGVLPAIILGALFAGKIEEKLFNPWTVAIALLLGGIIILIVENKKLTVLPAIILVFILSFAIYFASVKTIIWIIAIVLLVGVIVMVVTKKKENQKIDSIKDLSFKTAFFIGLIQCLSMIPGTSRSAATIIGAMVLGNSRIVATEFSFFLSIPTMVAASAWSLLKYHSLLSAGQISILTIGFIVSFITALIVIKFLINYVQKNNFKIFGYYRIILGIIIIAFFLIK